MSQAKHNGGGMGRGRGKKGETLTVIEQWVQVRVEEGRTVTKRYPVDEELLKEVQEMEPAPALVYRRLDFVDGIPEEYWWVTGDEQARQYGGAGFSGCGLRGGFNS